MLRKINVREICFTYKAWKTPELQLQINYSSVKPYAINYQDLIRWRGGGVNAISYLGS